jgi:hypothetical protein
VYPEMGAGKKKDLKVSLNAFFSSHQSYSTIAMVRKKGKQAYSESAVQWIVVCCVREGWIAPENESIDSLPIEWTVDAMIYFTGEVSGSSPGWPSCANIDFSFWAHSIGFSFCITLYH